MFRYERKFRLPNKYYNQIKNKIELHGWFKQFNDRKVNNIYFDDSYFNIYNDSINGHLNKKKYRIRWYGNLFIDKNERKKSSNFEIKIKRDLLNYKKIYKVDNLKIFKNQTYSSLNKIIKKQILNNINDINLKYIETLEPQFINQYAREYYIDMKNEIRLTIDRNLNYYSIRPSISYVGEISDIIIELKFKSSIKFKNFIIQSNLIQNSKFMSGIDRLLL
jgi:SPX domain protein involved in polyphosphate accumulation